MVVYTAWKIQHFLELKKEQAYAAPVNNQARYFSVVFCSQIPEFTASDEVFNIAYL